MPGVAQVLHADDASGQPVAEDVAALVAASPAATSHLLAAATTFGKNVMPRVAALLDVAQISRYDRGASRPDTFKRHIYAGNVLATVQSLDANACLPCARRLSQPPPREAAARR